MKISFKHVIHLPSHIASRGRPAFPLNHPNGIHRAPVPTCLLLTGDDLRRQNWWAFYYEIRMDARYIVFLSQLRPNDAPTELKAWLLVPFVLNLCAAP